MLKQRYKALVIKVLFPIPEEHLKLQTSHKFKEREELRGLQRIAHCNIHLIKLIGNKVKQRNKQLRIGKHNGSGKSQLLPLAAAKALLLKRGLLLLYHLLQNGPCGVALSYSRCYRDCLKALLLKLLLRHRDLSFNIVERWEARIGAPATLPYEER